jgi:hypothetical protein
MAGKKVTKVPLDLSGAGSDAVSHPWPPVKGCREATPLSQEDFFAQLL